VAGNSQIQIITDGTAILPIERLRELSITALPIVARVGNKSFMYDQQTPGHIDLLTESRKTRGPIEIAGPSPDDFRAAFERSLYRTNRMLVILSSGRLSPVVLNARTAARDFMGRCDITILDSQSVSVGLGILLERAGELLQCGDLPLSEVVRLIRGMIPRIYMVMISHTLDYIYRSGKITSTQAILGAMLKDHPFIEMEDGDVVPMEKSRRPERALDKLVEFASEFSRIQRLVICHAYRTPDSEVLDLMGRLEQASPSVEIPTIAYDPIVASHVGPEGLGLVIYEGVWR